MSKRNDDKPVIVRPDGFPVPLNGRGVRVADAIDESRRVAGMEPVGMGIDTEPPPLIGKTTNKILDGDPAALSATDCTLTNRLARKNNHPRVFRRPDGEHGGRE